MYDIRVSNNCSDNICAWSEGGSGLNCGRHIARRSTFGTEV